MTFLVIAVILGLVRSGGAYDQGMGFLFRIYMNIKNFGVNSGEGWSSA